MTGNDRTPDKGLLGSWLPTWPAGPSWLYWVTQGVHVTLGLVLIPIVLAKLWSVLPKLFEWPPARSITHLVERASLLLVGGAVFELVALLALRVNGADLTPDHGFPARVPVVARRGPGAGRHAHRPGRGGGPHRRPGAGPG